jgi:hypothetical protein
MDTHRSLATSALGNWRLAFDGRHKYVEQQSEPSALYDLHADPGELHNLLTARPDIVKQLRSALASNGG